MIAQGSRDYFEAVSAEWDSMSNSFFGEAPRENIFESLEFKIGQIVVDLGCGTGYLTEKVPLDQVSVIAIDQSQEMLTTMREKFGPNAPIDYRVGLADNLPIDSNSVDVVMSNMYLHHVEDPQLAIAEMGRILKPGGKMILSDLRSHDYEFLRTEHHDRWMGFEADAVVSWMMKAGLKDVTISDVGGNCCASSNCSNEIAKVDIFMAIGKK